MIRRLKPVGQWNLGYWHDDPCNRQVKKNNERSKQSEQVINKERYLIVIRRYWMSWTGWKNDLSEGASTTKLMNEERTIKAALRKLKWWWSGKSPYGGYMEVISIIKVYSQSKMLKLVEVIWFWGINIEHSCETDCLNHSRKVRVGDEEVKMRH